MTEYADPFFEYFWDLVWLFLPSFTLGILFWFEKRNRLWWVLILNLLTLLFMFYALWLPGVICLAIKYLFIVRIFFSKRRRLAYYLVFAVGFVFVFIPSLAAMNAWRGGERFIFFNYNRLEMIVLYKSFQPVAMPGSGSPGDYHLFRVSPIGIIESKTIFYRDECLGSTPLEDYIRTSWELGPRSCGS